jgi:hypothetical protein
VARAKEVGWGIPLKEAPATRLSRCKHSLKKLQAIFCKKFIYFISGKFLPAAIYTDFCRIEPITVPIFKAIAAMSLNRVIGNANRIPWHLPENSPGSRKPPMGHTS